MVISKLIPTMRSKAPARILSFALNTVHFLKLYPLHFQTLYPLFKLSLSEGRTGTVWEPSKQENLLPPFKIVFVTTPLRDVLFLPFLKKGLRLSLIT
jgi:hypothetical protein